jgi:hypothetical protein
MRGVFCLFWMVECLVVRVMTVRSHLQEPRSGLLDCDQVPERVIVDNEQEEGAKEHEAQENPEQRLSASPKRIDPGTVA